MKDEYNIDIVLTLPTRELKKAITEEIARRYWAKIFEAQDDLILHGTNGASDESLAIFGLERTYPEK